MHMIDRNRTFDEVCNEAERGEAVAKKPYHSPELVRHGSLLEMTQAGAAAVNDGPGYS